MSSIFGGNEAELIAADSLGQLQRAPRGVAGEHPHEGIVMISTLQSIERELRRIRSFTPEYGRQFRRQDGGQVPASGNLAFVLEGPKSGNDWYVERVAVSVAANIAAASVALYEGNTADESQLIDSLPALSAGPPSRGTLDGHGGAAYFIDGGRPVVVALFAAGVGNGVNVKLQGREVLSGSDPALRAQSDY